LPINSVNLLENNPRQSLDGRGMEGRMPRPIRLNAFDMNCVAHQSPGLWRHPDDRAADYRKLSYWTDLAQLLEKGRFDGLFIADVLGIYDVYGGSRDATIRQATQVPVNDPAMLVSAMAGVTEHLGFGLTASISFEHPYPFARRMSTLDHLTEGRVGWNIVTSYLDSGARNLGESAQLNHDNRYDVADEYLEVCYKLWEGSWEDDAVLRDRETGVFADPSKVHGIGHEGEFFKVPGIHLCEPSPQRSPVIYQAGASDRGRQFAAEHAEAIFTAAPTKEQLAEVVADIRARMKAVGRDPYDARIYTLMTAIVDETREKAWAKHDELERYGSDEGSLVLFSGWMGIDLSEYDLDDPIGEVESNAVQSAVKAFQQADNDGREWKVRDIARWGGVGGLGPRMVGSAAEVADQMQEWIEVSDVDGFNLAYAITPGTFVDLVEHLIPELQRRGVHPTDYPDGTLRERLFGRGPRLEPTHPGSRFRDLAGAEDDRYAAAAA
jgi:FMN-dependent oxidoreductase (nitrilotriacetate monooxygenase family)